MVKNLVRNRKIKKLIVGLVLDSLMYTDARSVPLFLKKLADAQTWNVLFAIINGAGHVV